MASNGRVYLFGSGEQKTNPIHGEDLADACIDAIEQADLEIKIGGPDTLTFNEIANIAFESMAKETKVTHIPDWVRKMILKSMRLHTSSKTYGPFEFFLTVTSIDMTAPERGTHHLKDHFTLLSESIS